MQPKPKCSHVGFWVAIALLTLFTVLSVVINAGLFIGLLAKRGGGEKGGKAEDEFPSLVERWSYGDGDVKAARIKVEGAIFRESDDRIFGTGYDKIESLLREIRAARNDDDVKAIILEVDSPGGELTPSDEIYKALVDFKKSADGRKVIVFVTGLAASGGYYISMPADWIIAEPTAIVGSIGVIMQTLNLKGLSDKIGVTDTTIKSGTNKDLLNPFHDVPPEQLALLQDVVDGLYQRFFTIVQTARNIQAEQLKGIADGRIFTADVSLHYKLIDQIGYWDDVVAKTKELLSESSVKFVRYEQRPDFFELLSQIRMPLKLSELSHGNTPKFMYLWRP